MGSQWWLEAFAVDEDGERGKEDEEGGEGDNFLVETPEEDGGSFGEAETDHEEGGEVGLVAEAIEEGGEAGKRESEKGGAEGEFKEISEINELDLTFVSTKGVVERDIGFALVDEANAGEDDDNGGDEGEDEADDVEDEVGNMEDEEGLGRGAGEDGGAIGDFMSGEVDHSELTMTVQEVFVSALGVREGGDDGRGGDFIGARGFVAIT